MLTKDCVFSLSDDDKGMVCDLCKGCFFLSFFLHSLMNPSYINFNKFLRICLCLLISAGGWFGVLTYKRAQTQTVLCKSLNLLLVSLDFVSKKLGVF